MNKKMKRTIAIAVTVAITASMTTSVTYAKGKDEDVSGSLTLWYNTYSYEKALDAMIEAFNEKYPNVEVDYEIKADGDYDSLLKTAIQSGDGPDLFWTNGSVTTTMKDLAENDAIVDLTDKVDYSFISDSAMDLVKVDEKAYAVPWMNMDTRAVFYNKDMFNQ